MIDLFGTTNMDDDFGDDVDFSAAITTSNRPTTSATSGPSGQNNPPQHQNGPPKVQQPKPQALPQRSGPSAILVSPRQKGNPLLKSIKAVPWEYSDIPADYVLGLTTCAFFLSIKYHRLHPEYIYNRIRQLQGKYQLRILLTLVDVDDHEEPLRELSKTSLINNVTVMLCWSAAEAARYIELYKTYEHASPASTAIRGQRAETYGDRMVAFVTAPRSVNKTDAVGLVSNFGSLRTAVNARPEEVALVAGWGEKKVKRWCGAVREPFRVKKAAKRTLGRENTVASLARDVSIPERREEDDGAMIAARIGEAIGGSAGPSRPSSAALGTADADRRDTARVADDAIALDAGAQLDDEAALAEAEAEAAGGSRPPTKVARTSKTGSKSAADDGLSEGVRAALAKLRDQG